VGHDRGPPHARGKRGKSSGDIKDVASVACRATISYAKSFENQQEQAQAAPFL
jgi:hypothetical protein